LLEAIGSHDRDFLSLQFCIHLKPLDFTSSYPK
jgi:hypothetical protein